MSPQMRERILSWFQHGLDAVDPLSVTQRALQEIDPGNGKLIVLAIGKAAIPMAVAAREVLGDRIDSGLLVTKRGQITEEVDGFTSIEAAHPIPDEHSLRAGELALDLVSDLDSSDTVLALISGGGSALMECPIEGISLMDMQVTTELLMYAGAGIYDLNTVRKALSAVKGGGLRRVIGDARCITLMLSDVIGNDHTVIASGPTVPTPSNRIAAWQVIEEFKVQANIPEAVRQSLTADMPPLRRVDISQDIRTVIADNATFVSAIEFAAADEGLSVERRWENWREDAGDLAHRVVQDCRNAAPHADVLIGGGEATSVVRGDGRGGRNTEMALIAATLLNQNEGWIIGSLASDGDDGNSGAAGAIVGDSTVEDHNEAAPALANSDSAGFLATRGALVQTGQTGTNVNDVYIAVRSSALSGVLQ